MLELNCQTRPWKHEVDSARASGVGGRPFFAPDIVKEQAQKSVNEILRVVFIVYFQRLATLVSARELSLNIDKFLTQRGHNFHRIHAGVRELDAHASMLRL